MGNLAAFLAENAIKTENTKYVASKRYVGEDGEPIEWEIQCITSTEDEELRKSCTKKVQVPGKRNMYVPETDFNKYLGMLAVKCTVYPNMNDVELQNSYGVMGGDTLLKTMLTPGEYADYLAKVQEINGFQTFQDQVDEAKN